MKIATIAKAFEENNMSPLTAFAESIMNHLTDCPDEVSLVVVNGEHVKGLGLMYRDIEIAVIALPMNEEDAPYYEALSDWLDFNDECAAGHANDNEMLAALIQERVIDKLPELLPMLNRYTR